MDESREPKVTLTRLRRRVSIESEGGQSPSTPSTPTKKRATRLAKPALELIDENVSDDVPKRATRKSVSRDVELVEEKAAPLTPSRRSARIRSNTSLVADAGVAVGSPRATRAARRNSQLGSDTETATPVKATRRTRKDSTSSVEKLAITNASDKISAPVADPIVEEPEKETIKEDYLDVNASPPLRKSPRLNKNKNFDAEVTKEKDKSLNKSKLDQSNAVTVNDDTSLNIDKDEKNSSKKQNLSVTSSNLINDLGSPKISDLNKTATVIEEKNQSNRQRTKSWTTVTNKSIIDEKNNNKEGLNVGSGDNINEQIDVKVNTSNNKSLVFNPENKENILYMDSEDVLDSGETSKLLQMTPSANIQSMVMIEDSDSNSGKLTIDIKNTDGEKNEEDQCVPVVQQPTPRRSPRKSESFVVEPMDIDETIPTNVTINDYSDKTDSSREEDANNSKRKSSISQNNEPNASNKSMQNPEVNDLVIESANKSKRNLSISLQQELNTSKRKSSIGSSKENDDSKMLNKSEKFDKSRKSIAQNEKSKINDDNDTVTKIVAESKRKTSINAQDNEKINDSANKSKRTSMSESQADKTSNENKSTLVLSQLKDVSANDTANVSKSNEDNEHSKSALIPDKKNISLNYFSATAKTSTPLQQKPLQKIGMQVNTSIISPNVSKNNSNVESKSKKRVSEIEENSSSDDESAENSMFDDEAEEASDDYESGDSRNEEERRYEEENEIVEKGETLESEKYSSNESDDEYEKDSFVVSSDEEDRDLLSGSGDDLSLSDNELKMTAKSKKKYNERKIKEQKKASKEMYDARHKLNSSKKSRKARLESSSSEEAQPKKKNRLRIDSSHEISLNKSEIIQGKKKVRQLSESVCEDGTNEKEITICNQSSEQNDPLIMAVKQEPKTPLKNLDISTVVINNNIEEVELNKSNTSMMKTNETLDPLQATLAQEEDSESDISENMEIKQNYDSVLESLNRSNKQKKVKTADTSLNINKKSKETKEPIVDQLNLTGVKSKKGKSKEKVKENVEKIVHDEETSDSIDMKLLFTEDSNDSEVNASKFKAEQKPEKPVEEFISLNKSASKTNNRESMDLNKSHNTSELNVSKKKNKNRKSSQTIVNDEVCTDEPDAHASFFIDTVGALEVDTSVQNSAKKNKKNKNSNLSQENIEIQECMDEVEMNAAEGMENPSLEVSIKSDKKKKKHKNKDVSISHEDSFNQSLSQSGKKKHKISESFVDDKLVIEEEVGSFFTYTAGATEVDTSLQNSAKKKKKKNKAKNLSKEYIAVQESMDISVVEDEKPTETEATSLVNPVLEVSIKSDKKKKKNKNKDVSIGHEVNLEQSVLQSGKKNKKDVSICHEDKLEQSGKKKRKTSGSFVEEPTFIEHDEILNESKSEKKKRKISQNDDAPTEERIIYTADENLPINEEPQKKSKKNKKSKHQNISNEIKQAESPQINPKKRKADEDVSQKISKISKENSLDSVHVPRLPESIVNQLDDKPRKNKKQKVIATTQFQVQETKVRRNKPSNYLEQSVYLNDSPVKKKQKASFKNPKVLPFTPTVITSEQGYTSNFRINVLPQDTQFVAQANDIPNFKNEFLSNQRIKKLGTFEKFKRQRNHKISKF